MSTMNKDEDHGSEAGNSNASSNSQPKKRRQPCCMRCDNHGLVIGLKQHKRYCKYQFCKCPACQLTVERQRVQARQTALKRAIEMDRSKKILPVETKPMPLDMDIYLLNLSKKQRTVKKYKNNIVLNNECRAERGRSLALKSLKRKSLDAKKNRCTTKRDINVLARYCLEQLRHLSYVQPFSLAHTLLRIIDDFDECSKQDINEAMSRISYVISETVKEYYLRYYYYYPILPRPLETPTYEGLYPIEIGIPQNSFQPITRPPNTLSTPPCPDNPPAETSPAPYH
ncbi:uncharacterized protein LOC105274942 isoform X4 [Ooceraea biroi]|uniref:uncharacterized protein LOC105274942 isoform X4 n=1 Tax=Ooceraea biroi TaxID=2015173 RepID=UPI0005B97777|nr:uncharacterized protein LOC105274942 isoform X4 [Ooceraea biroi]